MIPGQVAWQLFLAATVCQVADPESCWATSLRRASLTSSHAPNFPVLESAPANVMKPCCWEGWVWRPARHPTYRPITSHKWQHKALLPQSFPHGTKLGLSCWQERYSGVKGSGKRFKHCPFLCNQQEVISSYYFLAGLCVKIATVLFWNLPILSLFAATEVNGDWFNADNEEELGILLVRSLRAGC